MQPELQDDDLPFEGLVAVGGAATAAEMHEEGLVALACGAPYWVVAVEDVGYALLVRPEDAQGVAEQLTIYREERAHPRPPKIRPPRGQPVRVLPLLLAPALLFVMFCVQQLHPWVTQRGLADSSRVLQHGEWWRVVTALSLHADIAHITANVAGWLLFVGFLATGTGTGLATVFAVAGGSLGNLINLALLSGEGHRSLGASTALFAALGAQTALAFFAGSGATLWKRVLTPLLMSLALLALLGAGGRPQVDVGAHFWGYACGMGIALPFGRALRRWRATAFRDWALLAATLAAMAFSWQAALA